jgi:hypothetical protein
MRRSNLLHELQRITKWHRRATTIHWTPTVRTMSMQTSLRAAFLWMHGTADVSAGFQTTDRLCAGIGLCWPAHMHHPTRRLAEDTIRT